MVFNISQPIIFIMGLIFIWLLFISIILFRSIRRYNNLTKGSNDKTLGEILEKILANQDDFDKKINAIDKKIEKQRLENLNNIQRVGLLRFNPFEDVGGDQSFVLAMLNGKNDGIILTSLHSRTGNRWYGKTIKEGKGLEHDLSNEETQAVQQAQH
ncbi:MAG: DUF4446 family protein [Candidatus Gottesmanbacteria bacterium]